jgi:hypothetical protein
MTCQPSYTCGWCACRACDACLASAMNPPPPPKAHETGSRRAVAAYLGPPRTPSLRDERPDEGTKAANQSPPWAPSLPVERSDRPCGWPPQTTRPARRWTAVPGLRSHPWRKTRWTGATQGGAPLGPGGRRRWGEGGGMGVEGRRGRRTARGGRRAAGRGRRKGPEKG